MVSLKLLAAELLFACPGYMEDYHEMTKLLQDIYVPGEITDMRLTFKQPVRVYVSPNNPGAREVAGVLQKAMGGLELSTEPPPTATHFLLYLAHETFVGKAGEQLAEEVRIMMHTDQPIVMLHENDMEGGGCDFGHFFSTTPQDVIADGLFKALALAYYPGPFRRVSLTLAAKKLGAVPKRGGPSANAESKEETQVVMLNRKRSSASRLKVRHATKGVKPPAVVWHQEAVTGVQDEDAEGSTTSEVDPASQQRRRRSEDAIRGATTVVTHAI